MMLDDFAQGDLFITGEKGSGKSMFAVMLAREYLLAGRPVVTNLDLYLEHLMPEESRATVTRLPDKPIAQHLKDLGDSYPMTDEKGKEIYDESRFGLIILDECLTWLNSRGWQDKERAQVLDWLLHARKHGWNVAYLLQSAEYCDPQVRDTALTYHVSCKKLAKYRVPFIGKMFGLRLPRASLASIYAGYGPNAVDHSKEIYRGADLYQAYNTRQVFRPGMEMMAGNFYDMRAPYTVLSAWHLKGRYAQPEPEKDSITLPTLSDLANWLSWNVFKPLCCLILAPFYPQEIIDAWKTTRRKFREAEQERAALAAELVAKRPKEAYSISA